MSVVYKCKCGSSRLVQSPPVKFEPELPTRGKRWERWEGEPDQGMWLVCEGKHSRMVQLDEEDGERDGVTTFGKPPLVHTWHELVSREVSEERERGRAEREEMRREVQEHSRKLREQEQSVKM